MTRREFISAAAAVSSSPALLVVPVHQVIDARAKLTSEQLHRFSSGIWPEAVRDFRRCGIQLQGSQGPGEVRRSPGGRPVFTGLRDGAINLILTGHIPMAWDKGRALPGLSTRHEGRPICMIALRYAHGHQIPFVSVNTCVHELLHVLLGDIFENRPKGLPGYGRELRIDWYATRLWLFRDGSAIREAAQACLDRLRTDFAVRT